MNTKQEIIEYIKNEMSNIYCYNCKHDQDEEGCEWCHRKNMNWHISDEKAEEMATEIIKKIMERVK